MRFKSCAALAAGVALLFGVAVPAHSAEAPSYMNPTLLEQAVLRAQPGTQLGQWTQNLYYRNTPGVPGELNPKVCPSRTKNPITLPKAKAYGAVGYAISGDRSMGITMWQYGTQAEAAAALAKFEKVVCPDSPRVGWEDEKFYTAQGGSDFTETKVNGVRALAGGYSGTFGGTQANVSWAVRVVGLTVVKVQIELYGDSAVYNANKPGPVDAAGPMAIQWVDAASRAVLKFSGMDLSAA